MTKLENPIKIQHELLEAIFGARTDLISLLEAELTKNVPILKNLSIFPIEDSIVDDLSYKNNILYFETTAGMIDEESGDIDPVGEITLEISRGRVVAFKKNF